MKKRLLKLLLYGVVTVLFCTAPPSSLGLHTHRPTGATCILPAVCTLCHTETSPPLGHTVVPATCETASFCSVCAERFDPAAGHTLTPATCETPETCTTCGKTFAAPLGHTPIPATCVRPSICEVCRKTLSTKLGHIKTDATCTEPSVCTRCAREFTPALGHTEIPATCGSAGYCSVCETELSPATGHTEVPATCENPGYCATCRTEMSPALGHDILYATCVTDEHCLRCGKIFAYAYGHSWVSTVLVPSTCTTNGLEEHRCRNCGWSYTETLYAGGHDFASGTVCRFCGHTRVYVPVPMLWQMPQFPNGCESVSAVMAMRHAGADITADRFADECLPRSGYIDYSGDIPTAANPETHYIGNPRDNSGLYCFENALAAGVNASETGLTATPLRGHTLDDLCKTYIDNGIPVVFWGTLYMGRMAHTSLGWQIPETGEWHTLIANLHCLVLTGYDADTYYINDPLSGQRAYPRAAVEAAYADLGMRAMVVEKGISPENPETP